MSHRDQRKDPRVKRTLLLIRDALISLLAEKSLEQVTVRDITERAEINRATFYLHYVDKYDLLEKVVEEMMASFAEVFRLPAGFEADDFVKGTDAPPPSFVRQFEHIAEHAAFYKVMLGPNGPGGLAKQMESIIGASLEHRSLIAAPDDRTALMPRELIVRYATSAHMGVLTYWLEQDMPYSPKYMATQLLRLHALGSTQLFQTGR